MFKIHDMRSSEQDTKKKRYVRKQGSKEGMGKKKERVFESRGGV